MGEQNKGRARLEAAMTPSSLCFLENVFLLSRLKKKKKTPPEHSGDVRITGSGGGSAGYHIGFSNLHNINFVNICIRFNHVVMISMHSQPSCRILDYDWEGYD